MVALRIELSRARLSAVSGQPALDYLLCTANSRSLRVLRAFRKTGYKPVLRFGCGRRPRQALSAQWVGRRSNPRLRFFSPLLCHESPLRSVFPRGRPRKRGREPTFLANLARQRKGTRSRNESRASWGRSAYDIARRAGSCVAHSPHFSHGRAMTFVSALYTMGVRIPGAL